MSAPTRIGLVVPSSNTTIETEVPEMLRRTGADYTFHSSRAVLHNVDAESLEAWSARRTAVRPSSPTPASTRSSTPASSR